MTISFPDVQLHIGMRYLAQARDAHRRTSGKSKLTMMLLVDVTASFWTGGRENRRLALP